MSKTWRARVGRPHGADFFSLILGSVTLECGNATPVVNSLIPTSNVLIRLVHKYCDHQGTYSQKRLNSYPKTSITDPRSNGVGFTSYFATLDLGSVVNTRYLMSFRHLSLKCPAILREAGQGSS